MRREELYLADLIDNARAVRGYLDGVTREEPAVLEAQVLTIIRAEYPALAKGYEAGPAPDPGTASLRVHGRRGLPG